MTSALWPRPLKSVVGPYPMARVSRSRLIRRSAVEAEMRRFALSFAGCSAVVLGVCPDALAQPPVSNEVQKLLGHSSMAVTQVYSHLQPEQLHDTVNKLKIELN